MSVILNAPAVFRFTAPANPRRHLEAAAALGCDVSRARPEDAGRSWRTRLVWFMQRLGMPNGLGAIGYSTADIPALVEGTLPQHRVTKLVAACGLRRRSDRAVRGGHALLVGGA